MMRFPFLLTGALLLPSAAQAEALWLLSETADYRYLIDADSLIWSSAIPVRTIATHIIYFDLEDHGYGESVRAVTTTFDFRCEEGTARPYETIVYGDGLNVIHRFETLAYEPVDPSTNMGRAMLFACSDEAAQQEIGQALGDGATFETEVEGPVRTSPSADTP